MMEARLQMEVLLNAPPAKRSERVEEAGAVEVAGVARATRVLMALLNPLPPMERGRRKMDFLVKSISPNLVVKRATPVM